MWDILGLRETIGGAPFNVASYLSLLGNDSYLISRVGNDKRGDRAIERIKGYGIKSDYIKRSDYETGCAFIKLANGIASYSFNYPSAWDKIELSKNDWESIEKSKFDFFVYGTLALRDKISRDTFISLSKKINSDEFFFDVNFRLNFYSKEIVEFGLKRATFLKVNEIEEGIVNDLFKIPDISKLKSYYPKIKAIIVTKGEKGVECYTERGTYFLEAKKINAINTVGAGDSFSSAFIDSYYKTHDIISSLKAGVELSSVVCQSNEAVVEIKG